MKFSAPAMRRPIAPLFYLAKRAVSVVSWLRDWTVDRKREARIRDLRMRMHVAYMAHDHLSVRDLGRRMFAECDARSPAMTTRLERRALAAMDEHMREALGR